ncbi:MAG: type III pantothenate kinase [Alphaproteobacteria bacterium]|nr:type III pantothenate kinase [Alphaproteobacteria bacterium]
MLLAIDVGNSQINFAIFRNQKLFAQWNADTRIEQSDEEWGVWLYDLMNIYNLNPHEVTGAIMCCVVPKVLETIKNLCLKYFNTEVLVVGAPEVSLGLLIQTDYPEEVGADLIVDAVAGQILTPPPFLILNMGTATTLSLINKKGNFIGVAIAPGLKVALEALSQTAAQLPKIPLKRPKKVMATSTVACMQSGIFWGYIGLIEGLIARARAEYAETDSNTYLPVIASGGLANLIAEDTKSFDFIDPDLTLKGLEKIYRQNISLRKNFINNQFIE